MINTNISWCEKEYLHKCDQRSWWSPKMKLKVQAYDCNQKRLQQQQTRHNKTPTECERKPKINCKVSKQQNENDFKKVSRNYWLLDQIFQRKNNFYCSILKIMEWRLNVNEVNQKLNANQRKLYLFFNSFKQMPVRKTLVQYSYRTTKPIYFASRTLTPSKRTTRTSITNTYLLSGHGKVPLLPIWRTFHTADWRKAYSYNLEKASVWCISQETENCYS